MWKVVALVELQLSSPSGSESLGGGAGPPRFSLCEIVKCPGQGSSYERREPELCSEKVFQS